LDIDGWLRRIGLAQYAEMFRANDIDIELLGRLTNDDLKDIGVVSFGHRKKLLEAIAELAGAVPVSPQPAIEPKARDAAERRQVTVMFSDLVGSTALSARMDPEDLREIMAAYQKCVAEMAPRFGGFVAKYLGDGALVYFGYPEAHEDDAERAVRAGLELIAAVSALKTRASLQTRVGIATGLVVVGDLVGSGEAQERGIVGETPNLAARLQGIAEPNRVVIAEGTRKLLGALFELEDLGLKDLRGIAGPVRAWAALRTSSVESRFEALHAAGLTALVGREEEIELLRRRWSRAKSGEGQVVLLSGEAGIGKSRLTAVLVESLTPEPHTRLRYFCSPQHTDSAFYPIIGQMERAAGLLHDDTPRQKLDKLDALLAQTSTSLEDAALIAEMLSLRDDGRYPVLERTPEQRRQTMLEAFTAQMETLSRQNPVLMIFEDAHWSDPTSLEAFSRVVDRIRNLRVLLIVTFRPEFEPPWIGQPHVTALTINRLTVRDVSAMIDRVVGNKRLPAGIRQDIIERTDGIPLFVEETTKAVLEAETDGAAERVAAAVPSPALAVPASLHASLMARLDRLGGPTKSWHRSRLRSGANSHMPCWLRCYPSRRGSSDRLWTVSWRPVCCSGGAYRRTRLTCSSMCLSEMQHMAAFCAISGSNSTPLLQRRSRRNSRRSSPHNRSGSPSIATRPGGPKKPLSTGAQRASKRCVVRRTSKRSSISAGRCYATLSDPRASRARARNLQSCPNSGRHS
jgi:class 3 adenylate cyclase